MASQNQGDDGTQNGPGEQIRPQGDREDENLDNLRGGADPSGGRSAEVPRDNAKAGLPSAGTNGGKDSAPLSTRGDGRRTEDDLARDEEKKGPEEGGDT